MNHTPAPWSLNPARSTRVDLIDNAKGEAVGEVVWVDVRNPADARLIVAAPQLLDALKSMLAAADSGDMDSLANAATDARKLINEVQA